VQRRSRCVGRRRTLYIGMGCRSGTSRGRVACTGCAGCCLEDVAWCAGLSCTCRPCSAAVAASSGGADGDGDADDGRCAMGPSDPALHRLECTPLRDPLHMLPGPATRNRGIDDLLSPHM
jgi:hypothetical protein